jgi:hypothetical protein
MDFVLERMRRNPAADWTIADVLGVCTRSGVTCRPPTGGGSHHKLSHPASRVILTIPCARPVKPVYIRKLVKFIDSVGAQDGGP